MDKYVIVRVEDDQIIDLSLIEECPEQFGKTVFFSLKQAKAALQWARSNLGIGQMYKVYMIEFVKIPD